MKKIFALLVLMLCVCSCYIIYTNYECTITYAIDGIEHTETYVMNMSSKMIPTYVQTSNELMIVAVPAEYFYKITVYKGSLPVNVISFSYKVLRSYKASSWDGRELKNKK